MKFLEALEADMNVINETFDHRLSLIDKYMEFVNSAYQQNIESAELQYLSESDSDCAISTLDYLYQEAEEGRLSGVSKAIEKLVEIFEDFIRDTNLQINKFILDKTLHKNIGEIERKVMLNPFLRKQTVDYEYDHEGCLLFQSLYVELFKCFSILYNQGDCSGEIEALSSKISDWKDNKHMTKVSFKPAQVGTYFRELMQNINKAFRQIEDNGKEIMKKCKQYKEQPNASEALAVGRLAVRASKISATARVNEIKSMMSALSSLSKNGKKEEKDESPATKTTEATYVTHESVGLSFDTFKESLFSEYSLTWDTENTPAVDTDKITFDAMRNRMFTSVNEQTDVKDETTKESSGIFAFGAKLGIGV